MASWTYGSNTAGYLPDGDVTECGTWQEARDGLRDDMLSMRSGLDYSFAVENDSDIEDEYDSITRAMAALDAAKSGEPFATTTTGPLASLPIEWWLHRCPGQSDEGRHVDTQSPTTADILAEFGYCRTHDLFECPYAH